MSVYVDEIFDAINCSKRGDSEVSYCTVKRRSDIRSINSSSSVGISVTDKYFLTQFCSKSSHTVLAHE